MEQVQERRAEACRGEQSGEQPPDTAHARRNAKSPANPFGPVGRFRAAAQEASRGQPSAVYVPKRASGETRVARRGQENALAREPGYCLNAAGLGASTMQQSYLRPFAAAALVGLGMLPANAATIMATTSKEGKDVITLSGEIVEGDSDRLRELVKTANDAGRVVSGLRLNSPGGSLLEGAKLADLIRYGKMASVVANGAKCASACFVAFAAGSEKYVSHNAWVGVHGASVNGRQSGDGTVGMAKVVKELGVPASIIGKMVVTAPDDIVWLTPDELRAMGATMTGKPSQVASPERPAVQTPPLQQTTSSPQLTWSGLVDGAFALSARQNGGTPNVARTCQPELKVCNSAVFFTNKDGKSAMVRTSEDPSGKPIERVVCEFNAFKDVRTCVNWESGTESKEMKNAKGEWHRVE